MRTRELVIYIFTQKWLEAMGHCKERGIELYILFQIIWQENYINQDLKERKTYIKRI